jgi:hypothetical protein
MEDGGMRSVRIVIFLVVLAISSRVLADDPHITVDLGTDTGAVIGLGHNLPYYYGGCGLWNDTATDHIKPAAAGPLREAGTLEGTSGRTFIRFPGGNENEDTRWRRGVG